MKIGAMVESFRAGFRGGVEKAAALGVEGIQAYATYGELAPENMTAAKIKETLDIVRCVFPRKCRGRQGAFHCRRGRFYRL